MTARTVQLHTSQLENLKLKESEVITAIEIESEEATFKIKEKQDINGSNFADGISEGLQEFIEKLR